MTYLEKLRDPRWQKKRLKIFKRDKFKCKECGEDKKTLHVHHKRYIRGREPWDYSDDLLLTLCESCHKLLHPRNKPEKADEPSVGEAQARNMFEEMRKELGKL